MLLTKHKPWFRTYNTHIFQKFISLLSSTTQTLQFLFSNVYQCIQFGWISILNISKDSKHPPYSELQEANRMK